MRFFNLLFFSSLTLTCTAQLNVEFPWNPDFDNDDFIGITDLMALLSEFDSEFAEENIYLSNDSSVVMYSMGSKTYSNCQVSCNNLPGNWKMPSLAEITLNEHMWIETPQEALSIWGYCNCYRANVLSPNGDLDIERMSENYPCYCLTKELPKVEFSYCHGTAIQECTESKASEGWYPIGGTTSVDKTNYGSNGYENGSSIYLTQAFWRFADWHSKTAGNKPDGSWL